MEPQIPFNCTPNQPLCSSPDYFYIKPISTTIHSKTLVTINSASVTDSVAHQICFKTQLFSTKAFIPYPPLPAPLQKISFTDNNLKYVICQGHFLTFVTHSHLFHLIFTQARTIVWLESCNFQLCPDFAVVRQGNVKNPDTWLSQANIHLNQSYILNSFTLT